MSWIPELHCSRAGPLKGSCDQPPPAGLQALQISEARRRIHLLSAYPQGKEGEALKRSFLNFYQILWATLIPCVLIHWNQQSREIRDRLSKKCSGPHPISALTKNCHQCQVGKCWHLYTDCPLTKNTRKIHQKLYIIGNNLGQTKMWRGVGEHAHHLLWRLNCSSQCWPRVSILLITPEASSTGKRRW